MAAEYDINLSNGDILAKLYPLETNGPDNTSTPRFVVEARPSYRITAAATNAGAGTSTFKINGDFTDVFRPTFEFDVRSAGSPDDRPNNGTYEVISSVGLGSPATETLITVAQEIPDTETDVGGTVDIGSIIAHIIRIGSDMLYRFNAGGSPTFEFTISNSSEIGGTYNVLPLGAVYDSARVTTIIPIIGTIRDNVLAPIAPALGEVTYTVLDTNTSLKLPGKGTPNYGEKIIEDLVRMVEHFASPDAPELNTTITGSGPAGDPLTGQLWYNTTLGVEGYKHWDGSAWTSDLGVAAGAISFSDIENLQGSPADAKIYITASETNLPAPWLEGGSPALNLPGMVVWTDTNPAPGEPIFRVLSQDGNERLRVEHDGFVSTNNDLVVHGRSISVNADTGLDALLVLDSNSTNSSGIQFEDNNVLQGNIEVAGAGSPPTLPLKINNLTSNDVVMVTGGGNVGIGTLTPSEKLHVVGTTELDGTVNVVGADFIVDTDVLYVDFTNNWVGINTPSPIDFAPALEVTGDIRVNSQIFASNQTAADPTYSFTDYINTGMYHVGQGSPANDVLGFATSGTLRFSINESGILQVPVGYETTISADTDIPNKKYVDDTSGYQSWREPVRLHDAEPYANQGAFPKLGTIDGVLLVDQDIVLFSNVDAIAHRDIYMWDAGGTSWIPFSTGSPQLLRSVGDTVYVQEGSSARIVYAYGDNRKWNVVGSNSGINVRYEAQVSDGVDPVFNLAERYSVGTNRLTVYVDGVKQTLSDLPGGSPVASDYEETNPTTVTFNEVVPATSLVEFYMYDEITTNAVAKREQQTGLIGTPVINFGSLTYVVDSDNLLVFLNGQKMIKVIDYTETSSSSITWVGPALVATDVLEFYSSIPIVAGTKFGDIDNVSVAGATTGQALVYDGDDWIASAPAAAKPLYVEYLSQIGGGSPLTLEFATPGAGGTNVHQGTATLQVFVNGVYWIEGVNYTAGASKITLLAGSPNPVPAVFDLIIYEFA